MLPDNFYKFIGAIECTIHFISTQKITGTTSIKAEPGVYDSMNPYQSIADEKAGTSFDPDDSKVVITKVSDDLKLLIEVKGAFLQAAAALGGSLAPRIKSSKLAEPPSPEEAELAWGEFYKALDDSAGRFLNAAGRLIDKAPEWSFMDAHLQRLMNDFKNAVIFDGAGIDITLLSEDIDFVRKLEVQTGTDEELSVSPEATEYLKNMFRRTGKGPEASPLLQSSEFIRNLVIKTGVGPDLTFLPQGIEFLKTVEINTDGGLGASPVYALTCRIGPATSWGGSSGSFSSSSKSPAP